MQVQGVRGTGRERHTGRCYRALDFVDALQIAARYLGVPCDYPVTDGSGEIAGAGRVGHEQQAGRRDSIRGVAHQGLRTPRDPQRLPAVVSGGIVVSVYIPEPIGHGKVVAGVGVEGR